MLNREEIKKEVEEVMALLGEEPAVRADAYFLTRLEARIREQERDSLLPDKGWWPRLRPMMLAALVGVNLATAVLFFTQGSTKLERQEALSAMAQEYSLIASTDDWISESLGEE